MFHFFKRQRFQKLVFITKNVFKMYYFQNKILNVNIFNSYDAHSWSKRITNLKFCLIRYRNEMFINNCVLFRYRNEIFTFLYLDFDLKTNSCLTHLIFCFDIKKEMFALFGLVHERNINKRFYAYFLYKNWQEKTKIRLFFKQKRKNETFCSQKTKRWHHYSYAPSLRLV
jgi:hypothetical protein